MSSTDNNGNGSGTVSIVSNPNNLQDTAYATMAPSNFERIATLSSLSGGSINISFIWGNLINWEYETKVYIGIPARFACQLKLSNGKSLDGHSLRYSIIRAEGWEWDMINHCWKRFDYNANNFSDMTIFGRFYNDKALNGTGTVLTDINGKSEAWLFINSNSNFIIEKLWIWVNDENVWGLD